MRAPKRDSPMARNSDSDDVVNHALQYTARQWPVFPCHPRTKRPLTTNGYRDASTDTSIVQCWWSRWPKAMIGAPTGAAMGAFVLDLDAGVDEETGETFDCDQLQRELQATLGHDLPRTSCASTPRGGRHLYFALPPSKSIRNRAGVIPRVDVRGEGGYVIVPPSRRIDGKAYAWETSPNQIAPAIAPEVLLDLVARKAETANAPRAPARLQPPLNYGHSALLDEARRVSGAGPGHRNDQLNQSAFRLGQLVASGALEQTEVRAALEGAAAASGLTAEDGFASVRRTISSGLEAGREHPRVSRSGGSPILTSQRRMTKSQSGGRANFDRELSRLPLTDRGNAMRFEARNKDKLAYCPSEGWLRWDETRWTLDGDGLAVLSSAHDVVEALNREADVVAREEHSNEGDQL